MANAILNFHFDYWHTSLSSLFIKIKHTLGLCMFEHLCVTHFKWGRLLSISRFKVVKGVCSFQLSLEISQLKFQTYQSILLMLTFQVQNDTQMSLLFMPNSSESSFWDSCDLLDPWHELEYYCWVKHRILADEENTKTK